ncbi:DUF4397 domain-containing protein [Sphingobacterium chungjuense]|uniref:DUF4397 domain-containing protein n=1 Tax=Sphingobacterium chungjuense TaxID=2675553 RepID=UPI00140CE866|nr:DUF4397 domain-containing protein [Sphingobacterium chungjuense]
MKNTVKLLFILSVIVLFNSCMKDDNVRQPFAVMTIINAYAEEPRLTFALDRNNFHTGDYSTARSYDIAIGNRQFSFRGAAAQNLVDTTFKIEPYTYYSSFAFGTAAAPKVILTKDSVLQDLGAAAAVRLLHLANNVGSVQVYQGDEAIEDIAPRGQETATSVAESQIFVPLKAGSYTYSVRDQSGNVLATSQNIDLRAGFHRTLILLGTQGNTANPLRLVSN